MIPTLETPKVSFIIIQTKGTMLKNKLNFDYNIFTKIEVKLDIITMFLEINVTYTKSEIN